MRDDPPPIGGYFGLELGRPGPTPYPQALTVQSARAAFAVLLEAERPRSVWVPTYICDSMLQPLAAAGIGTRFYGIDRRFGIDPSVEVNGDELLLHVNYFGLHPLAKDAWERFEPSRIVLDHSQAFFCAPRRPVLATIYSPRKFFGVPDGGMLVTERAVQHPSEEDGGSLARCEHLLMRHAGEAEQGYAAFKRAEASLDDAPARRMSRLTTRLLGSVEFDHAKACRNRNFGFLHEHLGHTNELQFDAKAVDGPLCYPLLCAPGVRDRLLRARIFVPTYWPDVRARAAPGSFEAELVDGCVPLPCDQRYTPGELQRVVDVISDNN